MEELKTVERPLMSNKEFRDYIEKNRVDIAGDFYKENILHLRTFDAVKKFKSLRRAIRRGKVSLDGIIYPKRPFNNRANTSKKVSHSRVVNERKKIIYEQLKCRKIA